MACGDFVGAAGISLVEHDAGQEPALNPPFPVVDQFGGVTGRLDQQVCGLRDFACATQILNAGKDVTRVRSQGSRHGSEFAASSALFADDGDAGINQAALGCRQVFFLF